MKPSKTHLSHAVETKMLLAEDTQPSAHLPRNADMSRAFLDFKTAQDQRLEALEQKHSSTTALNEKLNKLGACVDNQTRRLDKICTQNAMPIANSIGENEAKSAWSSYIRTGNTSALSSLANGVESKGLNTLSDTQGGYIAPAQTQSRIDTALNAVSPMRTLSSLRQIGAGQYNKPVSLSGTQAGWAGETQARTQTAAPQLDLLAFPVGELYAMPAATQTLLDDSVADVDAWLADEVRDVFANQETDAFIIGDGVNKPRGLLDYPQIEDDSHAWGQVGYIKTGVDGGFDASDPVNALIDLIYAPASVYRAGSSFIMNRRTISAVRKFKDADGNYIWQPSTQAGQPSQLLGYNVVEVESMPDIASGNAAIAFGDFKRAYLIVDRQGIRVLRDPYSAKPYVLFYTTKRVGGGIADFNAVKLLKFQA